MSSGLVIRIATTSDVNEELLELGEQFLRALPYADLLQIDRSRLRTIGERLVATGVLLIAYTEWLSPIGFLGLVREVNAISVAPIAAEKVFWVDPQARATGTADALLAAGERWARGSGCGWVQSVAPIGPDTARVARWLIRRGYRPIETSYLKPLA